MSDLLDNFTYYMEGVEGPGGCQGDQGGQQLVRRSLSYMDSSPEYNNFPPAITAFEPNLVNLIREHCCFV